jgi:hypothetical protein
MARKNTGGRGFDALTEKQTERLLNKLRRGAEALPHDEAGNLTASEIYRVMNEDLHPAYSAKLRGRGL